MRHPFDGLIDPTENDPATGTTRRRAMQAALAGWAALAGASANDGVRAGDEIDPSVDRARYASYVVVPKDFRGFKADDRKRLGVHGGYFRSQKSKDGKTTRTGFLAWLTQEAAAEVAGDAAVDSVKKVEAGDIPGPGKQPKGAQQVAVLLAPNGWKEAPAGTFTSTDDLIATWRKQVDQQADVKITRGKLETMVLVNVGKGALPEMLVASLKSHPQVVGMFWNGMLTTQALGEEGATTKAVGEEGATTLALGEEGASTRRAGEEGGASTKRLGEEGGRPQPTTLALGEEGGQPQPSTEAAGEEG